MEFVRHTSSTFFNITNVSPIALLVLNTCGLARCTRQPTSWFLINKSSSTAPPRRSISFRDGLNTFRVSRSLSLNAPPRNPDPPVIRTADLSPSFFDGSSRAVRTAARTSTLISRSPVCIKTSRTAASNGIF